MDTIIVLDFGGQTAQLISRRIRELGVYSEVAPGTLPVADILSPDVKGIILSGSPWSVHDDGAPLPDPELLDVSIPVLGICYGLQQLVHQSGGTIGRSVRREYGRARLHYVEHPIFEKVSQGFVSWMSHGDHVEAMPASASVIATSASGTPAAVELAGGVFGLQFHPEVTHCEFGMQILENFAVTMCTAKREWSLADYVGEASEEIRSTVGSTPVLLLISGGVDSTVVAALLLQALPAEQVHLMYVDTGLMRAGETEQVSMSLELLGAQNLSIIDASERFLGALEGESDPEKKREIIGDLFMNVQQEEIAAHVPGHYFLAQGTLYTDMIESGAGVGQFAHVIKSHHNVRSPLVQAKREAGEIIEPLSKLYKDEVRKVGRLLGVLPEVIGRHPFPGPGLAVRILGAVSEKKCEVLRAVDQIFISEIKERGLYDQIWQAFAVLLDTRSVGVTGDARHYGYVVALRAVTSTDGMTADAYAFPMNHLLEISARITNEVADVGRVVYDVSSKPPATIEWE
jgi:GMP synthase (glutamine-hydrolysing)